MRTILTAFLALTMLVMLAGPALAGASQPPFYLPTSIVLQASDPAAQVRAALEARGYTVRTVGASSDGTTAGVYMDMVSATFDDAVRQEVVAGWYEVSQAYTGSVFTTYLSGLVYQGQYVICFLVAPADFRAWIGSQMSGTEFDQKYVVKVLDLKTGQWVTDKDFLRKNFGVPGGSGGSSGAPTATPTASVPQLTQSLCCGQTFGGTNIWSIRYPAGWRVQLIPNNPQAFQGAIFSDPQSTIQVIIMPSTATDPGSDLDQARNVDEFLDALRARDERAHPGFKEARREPLTGLDMGRIWAANWPSDKPVPVTVDKRGTDKGQMWIYLVVLFNPLPYVAEGLSRGGVSMLGVEASVSDWSRGAATYEAMLNSMQSRKVSGGGYTPSGGSTSPEIRGPSVHPWMLRWCPRCCGWEAVGADKYNWECPVCGTPTELWEVPCVGGKSE
jgi:hypothetical protein